MNTEHGGVSDTAAAAEIQPALTHSAARPIQSKWTSKVSDHVVMVISFPVLPLKARWQRYKFQ